MYEIKLNENNKQILEKYKPILEYKVVWTKDYIKTNYKDVYDTIDMFLEKEEQYKKLQGLANLVKKFVVFNNAELDDLSYEYGEYNSLGELDYILGHLYELGE